MNPENPVNPENLEIPENIQNTQSAQSAECTQNTECTENAQNTQIFDLLLKGGRVIDPANEVDGNLDVALARSKVAAIEPDIPAANAHRVVDVSGLLVVPGLIDLHAHFWGYEASVQPDVQCLPTGVTTALDAGGAGWKTFDQFNQEIIARSTIRIFALLNIAGEGMVGDPEQDLQGMDLDAATDKIRQRPDVIVGVKVAHYQGPGWEPLDRGVEAAHSAGTFVMVDQNALPTRPANQMLLEHLKPGDVATHCFGYGKPVVNAQGNLKDFVREARQRGIKFDVGHGNGSFSFRMAAAAIQEGFPPDTISTDMHRISLLNCNANMPETMSKMLACGMPLYEVIRASTSAPAKQLKHTELGAIGVGADADVAVLALNQGQFGFTDNGASGYRVKKAEQRLTAEITIKSGNVMWDANGRTRDDWSNTPPPDERLP